MDSETSDAPAALSATDRDFLIRTVLGEAGNQGDAGQAAVANVVLNRVATGRWGKSAASVVLAPNQFEPWSNPQKMLSIDPNSPAYKHAGQIVDAVARGAIPDSTDGATHFYSPTAQRALGRQPPAWASSSPLASIGGHLFYAPEGVSPRFSAAERAISNATAGQPNAQEPVMSNHTPTLSDDAIDALILGKAAAGQPNAPQAPSAAVGAPNQEQTQPLGSRGKGDLSDAQIDSLILGNASGANPAPQNLSRAVPSDAKPGPNGLMWNADGGYDPKTGELVIGGKPFTNADQPALATARAGVGGFIEGLPIVGPYAKAAAERGAAAIRAVEGNTRFGDELSDIRARDSQETAEHPIAQAIGNVAGNVVGLLPAVAAAPAAFGIGEGYLPARLAASTGTNALIGGLDTASRSGADPRATGYGAATGAAFGLAAPALSAGLSRVGNALIDGARGISGPARSINALLQGAGVTPQEAAESLGRLGPAGTLADIDPALTTEAGALAARGGATTSSIKKAMMTRAAGADDQASQLVAQHLGPKPDMNASLAAIENDAANRAAPLYAAGKNGPALDVTPILSKIDAQLPNASGGIETVLNRVKGFLTDRVASGSNPLGMTVPKSDPGAILGARQALDDYISKMGLDTSAGRNAQRVATDLRGQIDQVLKSNPQIAAGDRIYSQSMGIRDALQDGADVFKRNVRPEDLVKRLQQMTPEQVQAYRAGARVAIGDAMEQSSRGELAGAQSMFARGSANRAKLDALFPNAQQALDALNAEATMRATERQLVGQSVTAERAAALRKYGGQPSPGLSNDLLAMAEGMALGDPTGGIGTALARRGASSIMSNVRSAAQNRAAQGMANALIATGPEQQAILEQLQRAGRPALGPATQAGINLLIRSAEPAVQNRLLNHQ